MTHAIDTSDFVVQCWGRRKGAHVMQVLHLRENALAASDDTASSFLHSSLIVRHRTCAACGSLPIRANLPQKCRRCWCLFSFITPGISDGVVQRVHVCSPQRAQWTARYPTGLYVTPLRTMRHGCSAPWFEHAFLQFVVEFVRFS